MNEFNFSKIEEHILKFWQEKNIFEKTLKNRLSAGRHGKGGRFVFFEGPPTANGRPGIHHILARSFKDIFIRYKTMKGFLVERRAGWDTHGLPVELEVEKKLGIKSKPEIEKYGIAEFNKECKKSVWAYKEEWEKITARTAYWLDMQNPYVTYDNKYIETLWWIISQIDKKGLLYQDFKIVPYCPRCGTALSSHEVAQGYKKTKDPSVFVKFKMTRSVIARNDSDEAISKNHINMRLPRPAHQMSGLAMTEMLEAPTSFLVWTTTPWTLPANTALAVGPDIDYALVKLTEKNEFLILAKNRISAAISEPHTIEREFKGKDLIGAEYEPLYIFDRHSDSGRPVILRESATEESLRSFANAQDDKEKYVQDDKKKYAQDDKKSFIIIGADFVSTEDGTGIVHIAPAFGEDDMACAKKNHLEVLRTVDDEGRFKPEIAKWAGIFVKDADPLIIDDLQKKNLLYKSGECEHDYPFCWRCSSPLLYFARQAWFVKMNALRDKLLKENEKVHWVPSHLKEGRFGEWLKDVKDWAFSRERYWGTPLPIWICQKCNHKKVIGSIEDIVKHQNPANRYFLMRHAEAENNNKKLVSSWPETKKFQLTEKGKKMIKKATTRLMHQLGKEKIHMIFASDLARTRQTAEAMAKALGVRNIVYDSRLREVNFGEFNGKTEKEYHGYFKTKKDRFSVRPPKGESWQDVSRRIFGFLRMIDEKIESRNVLIIGHGDPLWLLEGAVKNLDSDAQLKLKYPKVGDIWPLKYALLPRDEKGELDLHKPYIDKIELTCDKCAHGLMKRIPEVADVWFDSGAMPFAEWHYPFENKQRVDPPGRAIRTGKGRNFPADFICEGLDQTRGWFYTLLAVSCLLGKGAPYKTVMSNGLVLDAAGQKMSKSKGNVVSPWEMIEKYGSDVLRWYFYTVNSVGESKLFDEKDLQDRQRNFVMTIVNTLNFYKLYGGKNSNLSAKSYKLTANILDKWILSRLNMLIDGVNQNLDDYDATTAGREIADFANDLSNWYVRRSRTRFRNTKSKDAKTASAVLGYVLLNLSKLIAPFTPFLAEYVFHNIKGRESSVHLENYPCPTKKSLGRAKADKKMIDSGLIEQMALVRKIVALGLKLRSQNQLKVRQPLASLKLKIKNEKVKIKEKLLELIKDELNIKEVAIVKKIEKQDGWKIAKEVCPNDDSVGREELEIALDTRLNNELRMEGVMRDIIRNIQDTRKDASLTPSDKILLYYDGSVDILKIFDKFGVEIKKTVLAEKIIHGRHGKETFKIEREFEAEIFGRKEKVWVGLKV